MDKELELRIINGVYNDDYIKEKSECPDFILSNKSDGIKFGVEVTQIFRNSSHATLKNDDNYLVQLLQNKFRKKWHKNYLEVDEFTLESLDGSESYKLNGVKTTAPSLEEYSRILSKSISDKNLKILKYDKSLEYINLIIFDNEGGFSRYESKDVMNRVIDRSLMEELLRSKFSGVFLLTDTEDGQRYFPLKFMTVMKTLIQIFMQYKKLCKNNNTEAMHFTSFYFNKIFGSNSSVIRYGDNFAIRFEDVVYQILPKQSMERYSKIKESIHIEKCEELICGFDNYLEVHSDEFNKILIVANNGRLFYAL